MSYSFSEVTDFPTQCIVCQKNYSKDSVLLRCECLIYFCQQCAVYQVANNVKTYNEGIFCPLCHAQTGLGVIKDHETTIKNITLMEQQLIETILDEFQYNIDYHNLSTDHYNELIQLLIFGDELRALQEDFSNTDSLSLPQLRLLLARMQVMRNDYTSSNQIKTKLPLGPLSLLTFKHNTWFESMSEGDLKSWSFRCNVCDGTICDQYHTFGNGKSVLYECECNITVCRTCEMKNLGNRPQTYDSGIVCMFCKAKSRYITGIECAKAKELELIEDLFNFYPRRYKSTVTPLKRCQDLHRRCATLRLATRKTDLDDEEVNTLSVLQLELSRIECLRKELLEKYPFTKDTKPALIESALKSFGLDRGNLPLGPLVELSFPRNIFLELASYLAYESNKESMASTDDKYEIMDERIMETKPSLIELKPFLISEVKADAHDHQSLLVNISNSTASSTQLTSSTKIDSIESSVYDIYSNDIERLRVIDEFIIFNEHSTSVNQVEDISCGYLEGLLLPNNLRHEKKKIRIHFSDWMMYPGPNRRYGDPEHLCVGDIVFFETNEDNSSVLTMYKITNKPHVNFNSTMIKIRGFRHNFVNILTIADQKSVKDSSDMKLCQSSWQEIIEDLGDEVTPSAVTKYLSIYYSQIKEANQYRINCKFVTSLAKLVSESKMQISQIETKQKRDSNVNILTSVHQLSQVGSSTQSQQSIFKLATADYNHIPDSIVNKQTSKPDTTSLSLKRKREQMEDAQSIRQMQLMFKQPLSPKKPTTFQSFAPTSSQESRSKSSDSNTQIQIQYYQRFQQIDFQKYGNYCLYFRCCKEPISFSGEYFPVQVQIAYNPLSEILSGKLSNTMTKKLQELLFTTVLEVKESLTSFVMRLKAEYGINAKITEFRRVNNSVMPKEGTFGSLNVQPNSKIYLCPVKLDPSNQSLDIKNQAISLQERKNNNSNTPTTAAAKEKNTNNQEVNENVVYESIVNVNSSLWKSVKKWFPDSTINSIGSQTDTTINYREIHRPNHELKQFVIEGDLRANVMRAKRKLNQLMHSAIDMLNEDVEEEVFSNKQSNSSRQSDIKNLKHESPWWQSSKADSFASHQPIQSSTQSNMIPMNDSQIYWDSDSTGQKYQSRPHTVSPVWPAPSNTSPINNPSPVISAKPIKENDLRFMGDTRLYVQTTKNPSNNRFYYLEKYDGPRSMNGSVYIILRIFDRPIDKIPFNRRFDEEFYPSIIINLVHLNTKVKQLRNQILSQLDIIVNIIEYCDIQTHRVLNEKYSLDNYGIEIGSTIYLCPIRDNSSHHPRFTAFCNFLRQKKDNQSIEKKNDDGEGWMIDTKGNTNEGSSQSSRPTVPIRESNKVKIEDNDLVAYLDGDVDVELLPKRLSSTVDVSDGKEIAVDKEERMTTSFFYDFTRSGVKEPSSQERKTVAEGTDNQVEAELEYASYQISNATEYDEVSKAFDVTDSKPISDDIEKGDEESAIEKDM